MRDPCTLQELETRLVERLAVGRPRGSSWPLGGSDIIMTIRFITSIPIGVRFTIYSFHLSLIDILVASNLFSRYFSHLAASLSAYPVLTIVLLLPFGPNYRLGCTINILRYLVQCRGYGV